MRIDSESEGHEQEGLAEKTRRVGTRHLVLGFLILLFLLFLVSWCSLPGR
ncbi:MAG: hypothetical protein O6926_09830 [candidate division NC10 bacterium]|nr:hypothetical protein [candidate division NC10 bacterium]